MTDNLTQMSCSFNNEDALYFSYMPFIKGGALFIRTKQEFSLGSSIQLTVHLMDEQEDYVVEGKVAWLTPKGAQGGKPSGVGVQLSEKNRTLINKIETYLAGMLKSTQITDTI